MLWLLVGGWPKPIEDALFYERYLLNSLLGTVPDAIYFKDARGRFIRLNDAMAARLGVEVPAKAIGTTAFDMPEQDAAMTMHRDDEAVLRSGRHIITGWNAGSMRTLPKRGIW